MYCVEDVDKKRFFAKKKLQFVKAMKQFKEKAINDKKRLKDAGINVI